MEMIKVKATGKTALVTGANRGIGKAIVKELLVQGASKVYAGSRKTNVLEDLKAEFGDRLEVLELDITNTESVATAKSKINSLDILINNAGVLVPGELLNENSLEGLKSNLEVNVYGLINSTAAFADLLKKDSETAITNLSSLAGIGNMPMIGTYSVSKAAVHSITQGLRAELAGTNTLVTGVYPGPIDTEMTKGMEMPKDSVEAVAKNIVDGLVAGKEDIYPDAMSSQLEPLYASNPKGVEQEFAKFLAE